MSKTNFFLNVDMTASFLFALLWFFMPTKLLEYNFELKRYDDIHIHFAHVLGIIFLANGMISKYALTSKCLLTQSKILSIKLSSYILIISIMILDNLDSNILGDKHVSFGIIGMLLLIINSYLAIRALKKKLIKTN